MHMEDVRAFAFNWLKFSDALLTGVEDVPTDRAIIPRILATGAAALEHGSTNTTCVVGGFVEVPLPLRHRLKFFDFHLHLDCWLR